MPKDTDVKSTEQGVLIDTDHPAEKELLKLARQVRKLDAERSEAQDEADKVRAKLGDVMRANKLKRFVRGNIEIQIKPSEERVSVRGRKSETDDGDGYSGD